jgi:hypothetical protein
MTLRALRSLKSLNNSKLLDSARDVIYIRLLHLTCEFAGYNKKYSFGLLTFDTTTPDPEVTYQIISIDDEVIWKFSLKRSQLTYETGE